MNPEDMSQQSVEWLKFRIGRITASRVVDVMNFRKDGKPGADRKNYLAELVAERLTGRAAEHYVTPYMERGTEEEPFARAAYEVATGEEVEMVGAIVHPDLPFFSASPDGLVGDEGMVEFKCPTTSNHLAWLMADEVPDEHKWQIYAGMACSGRKWCDFVSFDSRLPHGLRVFTKRLMRDDKEIDRMETAIVAFNDEVGDVLDKLHKTREFEEPDDPPSKPQPDFMAEAMLTEDDLPEWMQRKLAEHD